MKTKKNVKIKFRNFGNIVIPKGTKLTHQTAMGIDKKYHLVDEFEWIKQLYPAYSSILLHDAETYGINIPEEFVDHEV